ncbi:flagellar basal body-associated FliL family protein [Phytopseudomonas dryadis]|uniref:Flagellar protein FliL n=1 Tax=Phytopseudomonas dryadis TaxID=2487520 RepID=A0A4Q9RAC6_9GAMM|nr:MULTISPECIES: flagellar basal body-associated FliL family protein [Pseudomonas]TBU97104.1 flagellar basal body-associated protein FliL [Pseudomonas dryadis]TBV08554.1 flagellar basal body-associated protein FliL [Pseudomonas dryadis]TBV18922.1 flagellar basal body-associated protein FliL [Pseudomonas sp. FRB 230]
MKTVVALLLACALSLPVLAEEEKKEGAAPQVIYHNLVPALVGNYGVGPRLKFYKADVALRVTGVDAEAKVIHHEPLIRNQLVMLFSQQTEESLASPDAKELLRQEALKQVQQVLSDEEGRPLVEDLLFNNLILQG